AKPLFNVPAVWLGAMVPKRWAKRAVTRNTLKRQIYAVSQLYQADLPAAAYVVRLRSSFDRTLFISATSDALKLAASTELHQLLERATRPPLRGRTGVDT
ncbi:MAG: ribonuclease P protein component, partial [Betaproteobacteria bacterium HGW-Betaproteobacteria-18]